MGPELSFQKDYKRKYGISPTPLSPTHGCYFLKNLKLVKSIMHPVIQLWRAARIRCDEAGPGHSAHQQVLHPVQLQRSNKELANTQPDKKTTSNIVFNC
jgi:hypothetical protein